MKRSPRSGRHLWPHEWWRLIIVAAPVVVFLALIGIAESGSRDRTPRSIAHASLPGQRVRLTTSLPASPIKHIVFMLQENRSYDTLFGRFPGADGSTMGTATIGDRTFTFPLVPASYYSWHDLAHGDHDAIVSIDNGKMDGFSHEAYADLFGEKAAYQQQMPQDIPNLYAYAHAFTLSDRTFSPEPGSTFVNHLHAVAAQDGGAIGNPANPSNNTSAWGCDSAAGTYVQFQAAPGQITRTSPCFSFTTLTDRLNAAGLSWAYYAAPSSDLGYIFSTLDAFKQVRQTSQWSTQVRDERTFEGDARAGRLPAFSWVTPRIGESMHPPAPACPGENWIVSKLNALMSGPDWSSTLVVLSWDEWGGYYDHVAPPRRDVGIYGPRVPLLIISPYARRGFVTHTVYTFESVMRTAEKLWNVPPLTDQDASANDMLDSLNLAQSPLPPLLLKPRACPLPLDDAQYRTYLDQWLSRAITTTLGLPLDRVMALHRSQTLSQIAQSRHVSPASLAAAMNTVAEAWAEGKIVLQLIKPYQVDPETNRALAVADRLLHAAPSQPLFPAP